MNNEPVAWINEKYLTHEDFIEEGEIDGTLYRVNDASIKRNYTLIPLYTHPSKDLTDEKILKQIRHAISCYFDDAYSYSNELYSKIEAILRKANEK